MVNYDHPPADSPFFTTIVTVATSASVNRVGDDHVQVTRANETATGDAITIAFVVGVEGVVDGGGDSEGAAKVLSTSGSFGNGGE